MGRLFLVFAVSVLLTFTWGRRTMDILDKLLHKSRYHNTDVPRSDGPTEVSIGMYVGAAQIHKQAQRVSFAGYLRQSWNDPRLSYKDDIAKLRVPFEAMSRVWKPDLFVRNAWDYQVFYTPEPNFLMTLGPNGDIWYVYRVIMDISCPQLGTNLQNFTCAMMFESFGYMMDAVYFSWLPSPVDIDPNVYVDEHTLKSTVLYDCSQNYTVGAFTCLQVSFNFERD